MCILRLKIMLQIELGKVPQSYQMLSWVFKTLFSPQMSNSKKWKKLFKKKKKNPMKIKAPVLSNMNLGYLQF